jgi:hypothetical protein
MPTKDLVENIVATLHIHVARHGGATNTDLAYGRAATLENFGLAWLCCGQEHGDIFL